MSDREFHVSFEARIVPVDGMMTVRVPEKYQSEEDIRNYLADRVREHVQDYHEFQLKLTNIEENNHG